MASAWSSALRSVPGYVAGTPTTQAAPTFTPTAIPTLPTIDDARAPNAAGRTWLSQQLGNLPGKYAPLISQAASDARYRLAGYGGVTVNADNSVTFDPNAPLGQKEKQGVRGAQNQANAQGLLYSSFANKAVGNVLAQMSEEKRNIVMQYSATINGILGQEANDQASLVGDWVKLYGTDAQWLVDNPPPVPPPAPGHSEEEAIAYQQAQIDAHPGNPATNPPAPRFEIVNNPPASAIAGLRARGYKKAGGPGNRWVLKY